jgi:hypothetical protein
MNSANLCGNAKGNLRRAGPLDCDMWTFFGTHASKEGKIFFRTEIGLKQAQWQAVMNSLDRAQIGHWAPLSGRNGYECHVIEMLYCRFKMGEIHTPVQRSQEWNPKPAQNWQVQPIDVTVDDIEISGAVHELVEQD